MAAADLDVTLHEHGPTQAGARQYAQTKIGRLAKFAPRPILSAHVELEQLANPAAERPSIAKGTLDVSGQVVRAHVAADTMEDAVDRLEARLARQLRRLSDKYRTRQKLPPETEPGEWRRGSLPAERPAYFPRPPEERELVRTKTFAPERISRQEAFDNLDLLDHSFYLCKLAESEQDALVSREDGEEVVALAGAAPTLERERAIERLDLTDEPFVFFVDAATIRASVLYRRYDGHYGLITLG